MARAYADAGAAAKHADIVVAITVLLAAIADFLAALGSFLGCIARTGAGKASYALRSIVCAAARIVLRVLGAAVIN